MLQKRDFSSWLECMLDELRQGHHESHQLRARLDVSADELRATFSKPRAMEDKPGHGEACYLMRSERNRPPETSTRELACLGRW